MAYAPQRDRRPLHAVPFGGIGWGGKSELRRAVRRVIPGQGDLKESGTENIPPPGVPVPDRRAVRVKRCGKSAPRPPQGGWQAKPRTEQDRIGRRSRAARPKPPGRLLDPAGDGGARGMVAARRPSVRGRRRVQNSAYRPSAALFVDGWSRSRRRWRSPGAGGRGRSGARAAAVRRRPLRCLRRRTLPSRGGARSAAPPLRPSAGSCRWRGRRHRAPRRGPRCP